MELCKIDQNKKDCLDLLLLADPSEKMIERYLYDGELYVLLDGAETAAAAVLLPLEDGGCELKNIAVEERRQGKGIGSAFLKSLIGLASERFAYMSVGTTSPTEGFYKTLGFEYSHTVPNFFVDNYPEPIFEDGIRCVDMRYFRREL